MPKPPPPSTNGRHESESLTAALALHGRGIAVVPCNGKKPVCVGWNEKRLSQQELRRAFNGTKFNLAIVLNQSDLIDVECDSAEAESALQELFGGKVPPTPTWQSKRGKHRLFRRPAGLPGKAKLELEGIEFRIGNGKGAASIVPPSVHPDGPRYCWLPGLSLEDVEPAALPSHIVDRLTTTEKPTPVRDAIANGTRHDKLFRLACSMRFHGATQETIERAVLLENELRCDPPLSETEVRQIAKSAVGYEPGCDVPDRGNHLIDLISLTPPVLGEPACHGFAGEFIRSVTPYTEATDAGILAHLLCAAAAIIGPGPHVYAGAKQPTRINAALVGPTSTGRKGTSFDAVNQMFAAVPDVGLRILWKTQCVRGLSSGEGLIYAVADKESIDQDGKKTSERAEKRLFVLEPEFSKVLAHSRREGNILSHVMRESFDSGNLQTLTRTSPLRADGAHICICGHVTPEELRKRLSEIDMANGFGNRFLWLYVESDRVLPDAPRIPEKVIKTFAARLCDILKHATKQREIEKDDDAQSLWRTVYPYLRASKPGLQGTMIARGETIVLRLALIYALLDKSRTIGRDHIEAALAVWQYNEQSVRMIFSNKIGDSLQDKLYALLSDGPMMAKQFHDHMNKPAAEIRSALSYLESIGRIRKTTVRHKGAGRPAERWERVEAAND